MATGAEDMAKIWDPKTGTLLHELQSHSQRVWSVGFSPDGRRLATGSADLTVRLWDVEHGESVATFADFSDPVYNVVFSPDGQRLFANASGSRIQVYDAIKNRERLMNTVIDAGK